MLALGLRISILIARSEVINVEKGCRLLFESLRLDPSHACTLRDKRAKHDGTFSRHLHPPSQTQCELRDSPVSTTQAPFQHH